jgi:uncharacterized protein
LDQPPLHVVQPGLPDLALAEKQARVVAQLQAAGSALVAFSGGVDSALVLAVAVQVLGRDRVLAATAVSPSLPSWELEASQRCAQEIGVAHELVVTHEIEDPNYARNAPDRCYFCKTELYDLLVPLAAARGLHAVLNGLNWDDLGEYRPGAQAGAERGILSPLRDAGIGKTEVRAWAQQLGLSVWDKPALACLSSRIPYGTPVTIEALRMVDAAERCLRDAGFRQVRVRHHGTLARIEVAPDELVRAFEQRVLIDEGVRAAGYLYVTLDLRGYRSGSLNDVLRQPGAELYHAN